MIHIKNKHSLLEKNTKPGKSPRQYPEFVLHSHIADYATKMFIPGISMWHTTENSTGNDTPEGRRQQAKLKFLGAKKGFPDGVIFIKRARGSNLPNILFLELKSLVGVISAEQREMHEFLRDIGLIVEVIRTFDQFLHLINKYEVPTREKIGI